MNVVAIVTVAHHASDGELALTPVHGEALLTHTVRGLLDVPEISSVLVAAPQRCAFSFSEALRDLDGPGCRVVPGSLREVFAAVEPDLPRDSVVLLHDALRAFIPANTVREVINAVSDTSPVVVPVLPMADTVKVTNASFIAGTRDRSRLRTTQTPVGYTLAAFRPDLVPSGAATVPGHPDAMRVTTDFELSLAEAIAAAPKNEETL